MMRQYELVERVQRYKPEVNEALLNKAYVYAMQKHGHQRRASGDPYFSHPLEVAAILTDMHVDEATIAVALLHDTIEDTTATRAEIDELFGPEMGRLVEGLTKLKKLDLVSRKAEQAENLRKLLLAIAEDVRVLLVKLADRLHNMRTLGHVPPEKRVRIAEETMEIYAPLAGRMGMQDMREELEDLAFRHINPEAYRTVTERLADVFQRNRGVIAEIEKSLSALFEKHRISAQVLSRQKKPWSVFRKMETKALSFEQLSDIFGFRVIVETVDDCYRALGAIHTTWSMVPGRFKDYISTPKQNGYRSIHTTIVGPRHQRVELQLRTEPMHVTAEYGVAAHTFYKEAGLGNGKAMTPDVAREMGPYIWLRRLVETLLEGDNSEEFLEHTKLELFHDQVFCFTPKGRLIALPQGATPIDFAYAVHTDVGNSCVGASINGRQMPLSTALRNGDEVLILTSASRTPPAAWERIAVTGKARSAIRRAARDSLRRQYAELGRRLISSAFGKIGQDYSDDRLRRALSRLTHKTVDDVHAAVGRSELPIADVIRAIAPEAAALLPMSPRARPRNRYENGEGGAEEGWFNLSKVMGLKFRWPTSSGTGGNSAGQGIVIRGIRNDVPVSFEPGGAVPGDRIVGVLTPGEGIRIFQIHSPRLSEFEHERWIDVTWDINQEAPERFPARLSVTVLNEPGTLAQIAQVIGEADGNIDNLKMLHRGADFTEMMIEVEVFDLAHLNRIINGLKSKTVVSKVERVFA